MNVATGRPVSVLIVDDSDDQRLLLARYFQKAGCEVSSVENAEAAIAAYGISAPDVVVIDLVLPGMSGWELTTRVHEDLPSAVVVVTSVLEASEYPPAAAVLPKPVTGEHVRRMLRDHVPAWVAR